MSENGTSNGNGSALPVLTKQDFQSDQETRWCPGCGDYAILATVQQFLPELGIPPERTVFVAGSSFHLSSFRVFRQLSSRSALPRSAVQSPPARKSGCAVPDCRTSTAFYR